MRHFLLTTGSAVAIMLSGCVLVVEDAEATSSHAGPNSYAGTDIQLNLDEDSDYRVTGTDIELSGRVGGYFGSALLISAPAT